MKHTYLSAWEGSYGWVTQEKMLQEENNNKRANVKLLEVHAVETCLLLPNTGFNKSWMVCCPECLKRSVSRSVVRRPPNSVLSKVFDKNANAQENSRLVKSEVQRWGLEICAFTKLPVMFSDAH